MVYVLTEKTIQIATGEEHGQIVVTSMIFLGTHRQRDAVRRMRIEIPAKVCFFETLRHWNQSSIFVSQDTAVTHSTDGNLAFVDTEKAFFAAAGDRGGKIDRTAPSVSCVSHELESLCGPVSQTVDADSNR